jgi:hypothetical protein
LAFSPLLRAVIHSTAAYTINWVLVKSQLYRAWLAVVGDRLVARSVLQALDEKVGEMKHRVRQARSEAQRRRKNRRAEREKEKEKEEGEEDKGSRAGKRDPPKKQGSSVENGCGNDGSGGGNVVRGTEGNNGEMHRRKTTRRSAEESPGVGDEPGQAGAVIATQSRSRPRMPMSRMRRSFISAFGSSRTLTGGGDSGEATELADGENGSARTGDENV